MPGCRDWIKAYAVKAWLVIVASCLTAAVAAAARPDDVPTSGGPPVVKSVPTPQPATRPTRPQPADPAQPQAKAKITNPAAAQAERLKRINGARSWGYQLKDLTLDVAIASPYDLLVVDATAGIATGRGFLPAEVERLKRKPDGQRRIVVSYVSVGEAEDYRPDYFSPEYMTEDAPDWLGKENPQWKGNRIIRFCHQGWQQTILGDDNGRSFYNSIDPSPLYRLIELGFDGIYLDRVDVYSEVTKECPDSRRKMVDFIARLGAHARKGDPGFIVILQNAEELVRDARMLSTIDAIAKEDLFYGADHSQNPNSSAAIEESLGHLKFAKAANRPVFVVDYLEQVAKKADAKKRIEQQGFIPYIGPRDLGKLWLPGRDF